MTGSSVLGRALAFDYRAAELGAADAAMLEYAVKLTLSPAEVGEDDVEALREAGFDDTAILDICQVTAYYNYVNRLADGLGVELEAFWVGEELTMDETYFREASELRRARREGGP